LVSVTFAAAATVRAHDEVMAEMTPTIDVNYERRGTGSPLVLVHGIGHRWQAWNPVLDRLAEQHDVIAIDLPGFGRSAPMPDGLAHDLPATMTVLGQIFDQLGLKSPHIAGNSLGGLIAVEAAARGLVASSTALSPAGFWLDGKDRVRALGTLKLLRTGAVAPRPLGRALTGNRLLRKASLGVLYAHPERIDVRSARGDLAALRSAPGFNPTLRTGRTFSWTGPEPTVPLTIAWAELDRILPLHQAARARELLPNAHHVTLAGCGHVPMIDDPELVARTILDTCARADTAEPAA
jgi:pimeloyl-ACP methyl ester carboxylesterase